MGGFRVAPTESPDSDRTGFPRMGQGVLSPIVAKSTGGPTRRIHVSDSGVVNVAIDDG